MRIERRTWNGEDPRGIAAELRAAATAELPPAITAAVAETIEAVRSGGDATVIELGERFDGARARALRVEDAEIDGALAGLDPQLREALERCAAAVRASASAHGAHTQRYSSASDGHL